MNTDSLRIAMAAWKRLSQTRPVTRLILESSHSGSTLRIAASGAITLSTSPTLLSSKSTLKIGRIKRVSIKIFCTRAETTKSFSSTTKRIDYHRQQSRKRKRRMRKRRRRLGWTRTCNCASWRTRWVLLVSCRARLWRTAPRIESIRKQTYTTTFCMGTTRWSTTTMCTLFTLCQPW